MTNQPYRQVEIGTTDKQRFLCVQFVEYGTRGQRKVHHQMYVRELPDQLSAWSWHWTKTGLMPVESLTHTEPGVGV